MGSCVKAGGWEAPCDFIVNPKNYLWCFFFPPNEWFFKESRGPHQEAKSEALRSERGTRVNKSTPEGDRGFKDDSGLGKNSHYFLPLKSLFSF